MTRKDDVGGRAPQDTDGYGEDEGRVASRQRGWERVEEERAWGRVEKVRSPRGGRRREVWSAGEFGARGGEDGWYGVGLGSLDREAGEERRWLGGEMGG